MDPGPLIDRILDDEGVAAGLDEPEAMLLIRALSDQARVIAANQSDATMAHKRVNELCRQARQVVDIVVASRDQGDGAAKELARQNKLNWPEKHTGPGDLLKKLVGHFLDR